MGLRPDWPTLGVISLAHSYGFSSLVLPLLLHGVPLILAPSPLPETLRAVARLEVECTLPGVPALWRVWLEAGAIPACVRLAISAGAPLPLELEHAIHRQTGTKVHNFYGSTECGGIAFDPTDEPRPDEQCVGRPMANVQLHLDASGCLSVESAAVGQTCWPEPDTRLAPPFFHTTDLAELRDGCVHLLGRTSDLINVAGRKLIPETVEHVLLQHPAVRQALVFGVPAPDAGRGDRVVACVVASQGVCADDLRRFLHDRLADWQIPREWSFVESLHPNPRGKVSRTEWRERYLAGDAAT
jgi:acyl-CoA synthetase (AMP-forming)/AMP-acid ligase II